MNEFVRNLLSVFSLLECSSSLSTPFGPLTKGMAGSFSPLTKGMAGSFSPLTKGMANHLAAGTSHLAGHVQEVKVAATELLPSCWNDIRPVFQLLTRGVSEGLGDLSHIAVLIHGFDSSPAVWADELAKVILARDQRKALGVLVVNWEEGSRWNNIFGVWSDYSKAVANTRCLANVTAQMLDAQTNPSTDFHCIGHSLGAHVCGFFANRLEEKGSGREKVKRISGLDPAGIDWTTERVGLMKVKPMAQPLHPDSRLDASDADLVDVIHTDGNFAGTMQPLGDVDFYVGRTEQSLGSKQPGCGCKDNCDHAASFKLFTESVMQPVEVSKVVHCSGPSLNFTLEGCKESSRRVGTTMGYFYDRNEGATGVVGILRESTSAEMLCADDTNAAAEEEEEEWKDWDDWEDWGEEDEKDADSKKDGTPNQSSESSPTLSSSKVQDDKVRKIIQVSSQPRARLGEVLSQGEDQDQAGWLESVVPRCSTTCVSLILASTVATLLSLIALLCCYVRRTYTRLKQTHCIDKITVVYY